MPSLMHLLERDSDFQSARCADWLARGMKSDFDVRVRTIGRDGDWRGTPSAMFALRARSRPPDVIHAWGERALTAAALAGGSPIVFTPARSIDRRTVRWLRSVMAYRNVSVVCATATERRSLVERGVPIDRCHVSGRASISRR